MAHHAQHAARAARSLQTAKARRVLGLAAVVGAGAAMPGAAHADSGGRPGDLPGDLSGDRSGDPSGDRSDAATPAMPVPGPPTDLGNVAGSPLAGFLTAASGLAETASPAPASGAFSSAESGMQNGAQSAAQPGVGQGVGQAAGQGVAQAAGRFTGQFAVRAGALQLYPLAATPLDLRSPNVRVPVGGLTVSTFPVTAPPFRDGLPLSEAPVVGGLLP